jgi:hypothetical protein
VEYRVVGYDARETWRSLADSWPMPRRQQYLYKLDVIKPLSVDTRVWGSIFVADNRPVPPERFGFQDSWADLEALQQAVSREFKRQPLQPYRVTAIGLFPAPPEDDRKAVWPSKIPPVRPDRLGSEWGLLGYDVADQWMLSALSNCGFLPGVDDVEGLRRRWSPTLNQYHLFDDVQAAYEFKSMSDERLRHDHAPCFVFGLWVIR